jgi:ribosomal protein S18 acetylase RimI-like enzyme
MGDYYRMTTRGMNTTDVDPGDLAIRPALEEDAPALSALAARLTAFDLPPWRTAAEIAQADASAMIRTVRSGSPDDEVLIAERHGIAVGCLHMQTATDFFGRRHAHISVIATTEAAEGTGVGRALMAYAEEWTRSRELSLLTLNVFDANSRARRFYERAGFSAEVIKYVKELSASQTRV